MENSIEDTIKTIEKMIKSYREADECGLSNNDFKNETKALEHILSDYKRVLKEANRYKNMYEAEHEIHLMRNEQLDRKENAIAKCNELENENKTIKEANDYWRLRYCESLNNSIPIQKIKDKIEELNKKEQELQNNISTEEREEYSDANISWNLMDIDIRREVLQELLESKV